MAAPAASAASSSAAPLAVRADAGLGNKLRVLLSYREAARDAGRRLVVVWPRGDACPAGFDELFEPLDGVTIVDDDAPETLRGLGVPSRVPGSIQCHASVRDTEREALMFAQLRPLPHIARRIAETVASCGAGFAAVHVRRTDLSKQSGESTADAEFEAFLDKHASSADGGRVGERAAYVATDNAATQARLAERLGARGRVYKRIDPHAPGLRHTPVADAVVDLFVCAAAGVFKGTRGSTFSDAIWMLRSASGRACDADELHTGRQLRRRQWRRQKQAAREAQRAARAGGASGDAVT